MNANPPTARDTGANPPTTRDAGANPPTTRDAGANPPTSQDADARPTVGGAAHQRVNLPEAILARYEVVGPLAASSGEADLFLCRRRSDDQHHVIKYYFREQEADPPKLAALSRLNSSRIVEVFERGEYPGGWIEIMEYVDGGSVSDQFEASSRRPWDPAEVRKLVRQVSEALVHLHSLDLVHRDIKPANLLMRRGPKLDVVLTDFGIASAIEGTRILKTTSRTVAYAAPEAALGEVSPGLDWWPIGIIALELLTGHHPFRKPSGEMMADGYITIFLSRNDVDVSEATDERWNTLLRGLLTRNPLHRWGAAQVQEWLGGGLPPVHQEYQANPRGAAADTGQSRPTPVYVFNGRSFTDAAELGAAFSQNWGDGIRLLTGIPAQAPQSAALLDWLVGSGFERTATQLRGCTPERGVAILVSTLTPASPPTYNGFSLTHSGLADLIQQAGNGGWTGPPAVALTALAQSGALGVFGQNPENSALAVIDERWQNAIQSMNELLSAIPTGAIPDLPVLRAANLGYLLTWILSGDQGGGVDQVAQKHANGLRMHAPWYIQLLNGVPGADPLARQALITTLAVPADETGRQIQDNDARQLQYQQEQAARNEAYAREMRRRNARFSWGLLAFIVALILPPAGVWLGIRSCRSWRGARPFSVLAIVIGSVATVVYISSLVGH